MAADSDSVASATAVVDHNDADSNLVELTKEEIVSAMRDPQMNEVGIHGLERVGDQATGGNEKVMEIDHSSLISIYNELEDEVRGIFLLCGVYGKSILVNDLLKYVIGLGIFKNINSINGARQELEKIIGKLKESSLVLDHDERDIQMHDQLRDFAKSVASDYVFVMERTVPSKDWPTEDFLRGCSQIILEGNSIQKLPRRLDCPNLELLHLESTGNRTLKIPDSFFEGMVNLKVLDLVGMVIDPELPTSLVSLTKLKTLCLNACSLGDMTGIAALTNLEILSFFESSIKEFPVEIGQLAHLKMLDLTYFEIVDEVMLPNILSNLTELEELYMGNLNNLEETCLDQLIIDSIQKLKVIIKVKNCGRLEYLFSVSKINKFFQLVQIEVSECSSMKNIELLDRGTTIDEIESIPVRSLTLQHLTAINGFFSDGNFGSHDVPTLFPNEKALFHPLRNLKLISISRITLLVITALFNGMVPLQNLETMEIVGCNDLQYLFVIEGLKMHENYCGLLPYLRQLYLRNLGKLRSIVGLNHPGRILSFKMLKHLNVRGCNQLRYVLPLYVLENLQQLEQIVISDCKMLERVFEDDEEVRQMRDKTKTENIHQLPQVKSLILEKLPKFSGCCQEGCTVEWLSLQRVRVVECPNVKKSSLGKIEKPLLTSVEVIDCNIRANNEDLESLIQYLFELTEALFNGLKHLKVISMPSTTLVAFTHTTLPNNVRAPLQNLETMEIVDCNDLQYLFAIAKKEKKDRKADENYGGLLPDLRQLRLRNLGKLRSIVGLNLPERTLSFKMLNRLIVWSCNQLRYVLPLYVLENLQQLENIEISGCEMLERIFGDEDDTQMNKSDKIVHQLPQVKSLILEKLPNFSGCCQDGCTVEWLSLKRVRVVKCDMIQRGSLGMIDRPLLTSVKVIECNAWENNEDLELNIIHLFHLTDALSRLEELKIDDSEELRKYMEMKLESASFKTLRILEALHCDQELTRFLSITLLGRSHGLEKLTIENCQLLEQVFKLENLASDTQVTPIFPKLQKMRLNGLPKLNYICNYDPIISGTVELGNLVELEIIDCSILKGPFPTTLLEKLVILKIESCKMIEQVIEENVEMQGRLFCNLDNLQLVSLPKLTKFNSGHCNLTIPKLRSLRIEKCPELNAFTTGFLSKQTTNEGTSYDVPPDDKMDACLKLQTLKLVGNKTFEEISKGWISNINKTDCELREVEVDSFNKLKYIFPSSMLPKLSGKLVTLVVRNCSSLSDVFRLMSGNHSVTAFQNLKIVRLKSCDSLRRLLLPCNYPSLTEIDISDCQNLEDIFIDAKINPDEKCFPNLKSIVLENLPRLTSFSLEAFEFPKLNKVRIVNCSSIKTLSRNVSAKANNFMDKDSSGNPKESHQLLYDIEEDSPFGHGKTILLPQLQVLELNDLPKMQLWNQEPQIPVFQMLTTLKIIGCGSIEYLFSISVAQHLDRLKSLTLYKCENMVQVLKHRSGRGCPIVFVFQNLETLVLKRLPRLTSFCEEEIRFYDFCELKMVRVEDVPNMYTFVKFPPDTPNLKEVYVTYVNKYWRGDLNETIKYLHKDHEKLKKEVWKTDQSSPGNSLHRYKVAAESSSQGMKRTSWSFEEVETELH